MSYIQLTDACFAERIGDRGLTQEVFAPLLEAAAAPLEGLRRAHDEASLSLLALPAARHDLGQCEALAGRLRERFARIVVLGTGGSSLGGQALAALRNGAAAGPRLDFLDNLDPRSFAERLESVDLAATGFLAISKSGATLETLAQVLVAIEALRRGLGEDRLPEHLVLVSEPGDNPLRRLAARFGLEVIDHDPALGGRYSVLSAVGMLPALLVGLDVGEVRAGAAEVLDATLAAPTPAEAAPALGAAIQVALARHRGISVSVLMAYADRLGRFAMWYRQLWAESLGKQGDGTTPVVGLGPVDQHSQLQLYLDGPADKLFTLIVPALAGRGPRVDSALAAEAGVAAQLGGRTVGDLVDAEQRATAETLAAQGRPTRVFRVETVDERTIGALFMHFMLETIVAAGLMGVEPFDQPAVEAGKVLARRYLEEGAAS